MPSHLRNQSSFEPIPVNATYHHLPATTSPKQKMSLTQTYYIASSARTKLGREASRADHNLRLLVGHANLLDSLMVDLADAEREQEAWFNQSVRKASQPAPSRAAQWTSAIEELEELDEESDDSDLESDDEYDSYNDDIMTDLPQPKAPASTFAITTSEVTVSEAYDDDEDEYDEDLALTRVVSHHSPPELTLDSDESESDEDSMPSSPENSTYELTEKQRRMITTTSFYDLQNAVMQQASNQPMIAAC